jgi:glycosyltransferase involved in cell wall biosynthesis
VVIPNGINTKYFSENLNGTKIRTKWGIQDKLVFGFVGFVRTWHRLDRVLVVMSQNLEKNWHLLLIGDGPAKEELEQQADQLGIAERVSFVGVIDRDEIADYVSAFDIALQPDVVEYASPLKLFEYMALGRAILAPNRRNILEILDSENNALLFDPDDDSSFFTQLQRLCENKELREKLGSAARRTIEDHKLFWDENAIKVESLFLKLLFNK